MEVKWTRIYFMIFKELLAKMVWLCYFSYDMKAYETARLVLVDDLVCVCAFID